MQMATLKELWDQSNGTSANKSEFELFLKSLNITLKQDEVDKVFTILDIRNTGKVTFEDTKVFLNMTKVYDVENYPKIKIKKRKSSYKIVPE